MVKQRIYSFSENGKIHGYQWYDENIESYHGIVILVHGMAEHIERYKTFARLLSEQGFMVYGNNQRGHKDTSSKEDYGYMSDIDNLQILVNDVYELQKVAESEHPNLPVYIFGHSMGSFITQRYIELHGSSLKAAILCGSALQPKSLVFFGSIIASTICKLKGRRHRSKFVDSITFGKYNKKIKNPRTELDWLNRDEKEVDKYIEDEYCGGLFTISYFKDFMKLLKKTEKEYNLIPKNLPIFIVSGTDDPVGGYSKNVNNLFKRLKKENINDVTIKLYQGARHELLLETCKEEVMHDCLDFFKAH